MTRLQGPECRREERLTEMIRLYEKDILRLCYLYSELVRNTTDKDSNWIFNNNIVQIAGRFMGKSHV